MRRLAPWIALALILVATLVPASRLEHPVQPIGHRWLADALLNVVLFVPLGAALAAVRMPTRALVLVAAVLAAAVEVAQGPIPGRHPSLLDAITNVFGAATGVLVLRSVPSWLRPSPRAAAMLATAAASLACGTIVATGLLLAPSLPPGGFVVHWTPRFPGLGWYRGLILHATLGGEPLLPGPLPDGREVRNLILSGAPLEAQLRLGPPTNRMAPLVSFYDDRAREAVLLGADGDDLVFSVRARAVGLGLDQPIQRWPHALRGTGPGDTISLRARALASGDCVAVSGRASCQRYAAGSGWGVLGLVDVRASRARHALDALWLAALAAPVGLWLRRTRGSLPAVLLLFLGSIAAAPIAGLSPVAWWELAGMAGGCLVGVGVALSAARVTTTGAPARS